MRHLRCIRRKSLSTRNHRGSTEASQFVMRAIPIDVLRAFVAVVDSCGFTRAAEDLGRTQPTVSLQVKRLEELIEAPLFEKASRLILTRSGEICLDYGRKILAQHDEMLDFLVRQRS